MKGAGGSQFTNVGLPAGGFYGVNRLWCQGAARAILSYMRGILILTMVASQWACPLICLSATARQQTATAQVLGCPCCRNHARELQELPPASPDVEFGDCVCEGAVLPSVVAVDTDEHWSDLGIPDRAQDAAQAVSHSSASLAESSLGFCSAPPGRALRVALHSWQF